MRYPVVVLVFILFGCSSEEDRFPPINEDYCSQIVSSHFEGLSDQFSLFSDTTISKTGTFVLEEGDMSMIFRAWLSESAQKSIDIQYFIFSSDNIGLIAADYLLRAADKGVKIRLLVDDIMVEADADELLALDSHPNLSIKIYNPTANIGKNLPQKLYSLATDFSGFNQRMHNKTFIVDDKVVITGGRNIADEYFDYDHEYNFRDRDVLLVGEVVEDVSSSFSLFWDSKLSIPISDLVAEDESTINADVKFEYLHQYACSPINFWPEVREKVNSAPLIFQEMIDSNELVWVDQVSFVSDMPGKNKEKSGLGGGGLSTDSLISLIQSAKESIYIQSPYLVTTELSQKLFKKAIERGVDIKILTNSLTSTDNLEAFNGYRRDRETLLNIGVDVYEFKPDAAIRFEVMSGALQKKMNYTPKFGLHAKSMTIDHEIAVIGTFNLDPRSANLNTECIAIIHDVSIATKLHDTMAEELKPENAWRITSDFNPDNEADNAKRFQLWLRGVVPKSIL
ncbi:MAG: phospholipase D family protein [Cyclobacteriaceae bacterium]|nr:phospholipase D family protein [Cyclobacteriaceae bacterium]